MESTNDATVSATEPLYQWIQVEEDIWFKYKSIENIDMNNAAAFFMFEEDDSEKKKSKSSYQKGSYVHRTKELMKGKQIQMLIVEMNLRASEFEMYRNNPDLGNCLKWSIRRKQCEENDFNQTEWLIVDEEVSLRIVNTGETSHSSRFVKNTFL